MAHVLRTHLPARNWRDEIEPRWAWCGVLHCDWRIRHDPSEVTCARCLLKLYNDMGLRGPIMGLSPQDRAVARQRAKQRVVVAHQNEYERYVIEESERLMAYYARQVEEVA